MGKRSLVTVGLVRPPRTHPREVPASHVKRGTASWHPCKVRLGGMWQLLCAESETLYRLPADEGLGVRLDEMSTH